MRVYIHSVWDTAYKYKDILAKYNYEHILVDEKELSYFDEYDIEESNYNDYVYNDYITLNSLEDIENLMKDLKKKIVLSIENDLLEIEIYDSYREWIDMNRITEKDGKFYKLKPENEVYGWENGIRLVQIVGEFEDLMEKYKIESINELEEILKDYDDMAKDIVEMGLGVKVEVE